MNKKLKGLKCKIFLATNLESLQKMVNDFLKGKNIVLKKVKIEQGKYEIDEELKGSLIDFTIFYTKQGEA